MHPLPPCDVVIVGARCAGAATARLLAQAGLRVVVVDRAPSGSDTTSTHAFMRGGVVQLRRWGLLDAVRRRAPPIRTTTFGYGDLRHVVDIPARDGVDTLVAPRRHTLDALLVEAARAAGAVVRHGLRVAEVRPGEGVRVVDDAGEAQWIRARWIVGADGLRSTVARAVGAPTVRTSAAATATLYTYVPEGGEDGYRWLFGDQGAAFVIPTEEGEVLLASSVPAARFAGRREGRVLDTFRGRLGEVEPGLAARLPDHAVVRGFGGQPGHLRRAWGPGWALVGDAGFFRDPITAHGMTDALRDAELLARALVADSDTALRLYEEARDDLAVPMLDLTERIASFDWTFAELEGLHRELSRELRRESGILARQPVPGGVPVPEAAQLPA